MDIRIPMLYLIKFCVIIVLIFLVPSINIISAQADTTDTILMFVGEDQDIMSIASGREEGAWQAPAVAFVIDRDDIIKKHYSTLNEAIDSVPGFHVIETDSGIHSYLRGIPDSFLYLYDTAPVQFVDKISLHAVKRIEIVRGPGSVLWGPDAFAGIVNAVPLTGKDFSGTETGAIFSSEDYSLGGYINHGWNKDAWDGFFTISTSFTKKQDFKSDITRFWGAGSTPVPPEQRRGTSSEEYGQNVQIAANFSYKDFFKVSARFTDSKTPYSLSSLVDNIQWKEVRFEKTAFLKLEGKKQFGIDSALRFTTTISALDAKRKIIDKDLDSDEFETYGEITYEKVLNSGSSHFIAGGSFRNSRYNGVSVWDSYLPGFLVAENIFFLPGFDQKDYTTKLFSFFTQYQFSLGDVDLNIGVRHDDHDSFKDNFSYNAGAVWKPSEQWVCKALLGTAYRTPGPRQLFSSGKTELEEIQNISIEISRKFGKKADASLSGFISQIDNHVMDDPYAGLSNPNSQRIKGVEFSFLTKPLKNLSISGSMTLLNNHGPLETYLYNDYSTILPDGTIEKHFISLAYPYDIGPERFFNIDCLWTLKNNIELFAAARYFSGYKLADPLVKELQEIESVFLLDAGISIKNLFFDKSELQIKVENLLDLNYEIPGMYALEEGAPLSISIVFKKMW